MSQKYFPGYSISASSKNLYFLFLLFLVALSAKGQISRCYQPLSGRAVTVSEIQAGVLCVNCTNISNRQLISDNDENSYASFASANILMGDGVAVKDTVRTFPGGFKAGFILSFNNSLLSASILNSISLTTYNNGVLRETKTTATGLSVSLLGNNTGKVEVTMPTTLDFDEIRLVFTGAVSLTNYNIHTAYTFDPACGVSDNNNYCYDQIAGPSTRLGFNGGLANVLVSLSNENNITDGNKNTYATLSLPAGTSLVAIPPYVSVSEKELIHPAGNRAGFVVGYNSSLLTANILNTLSIKTYLYGQLQDAGTFNNAAGLLSVKLLDGGTSDQKELSIVTTKPFNEVRLEVAQTANVNVGSLNIYYAFESGATCPSGRTALLSTNPAADVGNINPARTGTFGIACIGQSLLSTQDVTDGNTRNAANYTPAVLSVGCGGAISVQNPNTDYPVGTYAGFAISKANGLVDLGLLSAITINVYKDGSASPVSSETGANLLSLGLLLNDDSLTIIGFKPTAAFDEIQIVFNAGLIGANLSGSYGIHYAFVVKDADNDGVPDDHDICSGNDAVDGDGDGMPDACDNCTPLNTYKSVYRDTDGDGVTDACDADSDDDGIADVVEDRNNDGVVINDDADGDGIPNYLDLDSDNDGISDLQESGISKAVISLMDANNNAVIDPSIPRGNNGMANGVEATDAIEAISNYMLADTDDDNAPDYTDLDSDNDAINDIVEYNNGSLADLDRDGMVDGVDDDRDGIVNAADGSPLFGSSNSVLALDTDADGIPNFRDLDSDNDLISDLVESGYTGTSGSNSGTLAGADVDQDGIVDTKDGAPAMYGDAGYTDPVNSDNDAIPNYIDPDSDNDGTTDIVDNGNGWQDMDGDGKSDNFTDPDGDGINNNNGADNDPTNFGGLGRTTLLSIRVLLQGALTMSSDTVMRDDLRQQGIIPTTQPYNSSVSPRFAQTATSGNEYTTTAVLSVSANTPNAIVDWVMLEFRSAANASTVLKTMNVLVQRDGDIVGADGNEIGVMLTDPNYYLAVKHRNHLAVMTSSAVISNGVPAAVDFTSASVPTYGANARRLMPSGKYALVAGDVNSDGMVYYTAPGNDRDALLNVLSGNIFGYLTTYNRGDVNFDAQTYYTAPGNDRDWILSNVLNSNEFDFISEQLP